MADHFQILQQQLAGKLEGTPGTAETLTAAEVDLRPFQDFSFRPEFQRFANDEVADDLGVAPDFVAGLGALISFGCILKSAGVVGTEPAIGRYFKACGLKEQMVQQITIGAISGGDAQFKAGESYTATGGKTGLIEADISAPGTLRYIPLTGGNLADTNVVTAAGDSATCSGASTAYAVKYSPTSSGHKTVTIQRGIRNFNGTSSQDYLWRLKGAMGTFRIEAPALGVFRFRSELRGCVDFVGAGALFTGVGYEIATNAQLPHLINATIQINGVTVRPEAFNFDGRNNVELDPDPSTGGGTIGYDQARISSREPQISMAPYRLIQSVLDDMGLLKDGTTFPVQVLAGTTPYRLEFYAPKCQIREVAFGARAGLETNQLTMFATRDTLADNE